MRPGSFSADDSVPRKETPHAPLYFIPGSARTVTVDVSDFPFAVIFTR
jgi:hypothetical protein